MTKEQIEKIIIDKLYQYDFELSKDEYEIVANEISEQIQALSLGGVSSSLPIAGYLFNGRFYKTLDDLRGKTMNAENKPIPVYFGNDC